MNKGIILLLILFIVPLTSAALVCSPNLINEANSKMICIYTPLKTELLKPSVFNNTGLQYDLQYDEKTIYSGSKYYFTIDFDVFSSIEGEHNLKINQGSEEKNVTITLKKLNSDINYNLDIIYPIINNKIKASLRITNNTEKQIPVLLQATLIPKGIITNTNDKIIVLKPGVNVYNIELEYNSFVEKIEYNILYSNKKIELPIYLEKDKMPMQNTNRFTALFTLGESNTTLYIIIDVILFGIAIVLFTMFIGRLGKYIVKK